MDFKKRLVWVSTVSLVLVTVLSVAPASANDKQAATQLVEKALFALEGFMADNKMEAFHGLFKKAKGVLSLISIFKVQGKIFLTLTSSTQRKARIASWR